ncbi:uncharacterized protein [Typha angustifolia]|uniref:uncharacterized protein n=1 Tax=Typha angustifolia TaxID=59011 RepID=UPI003C2D1AB1
MEALSTAGGFLSVKEGVNEMIKYLANEPSVGLFFVQQHVQASAPHLLNVTDKFADKIHEVTLHTEDIEDSICSVRSMAEYGLPIADEMIKDINESLLLISTSQPKRGLLLNPRWGFQVGRSRSGLGDDSSYTIRNDQQDGGSSRGYLSAVLNSAKQKAATFRWSQTDIPKSPSSEPPTSSADLQPLAPVVSMISTSLTEGDVVPVSTRLLDDQSQESATVAETLHIPDMSSMFVDYDKFKSEQEHKLREWLQET